MKTFVRARILAANAVKKVADVVMPNEDVIGVPDFDSMHINELREMCKEEGIKTNSKGLAELIEELDEAYELYPSVV